MAEAQSLDQDRFSCSVCLDLLRDPVTIPCGHSYCKDCIKDCWDHEDHHGVYSCPECRQTFIPRPVLGRNTMLAEVVEKLKKAELQAAPPDHCYAGPGDVVCDVCTGRKKKAVKSCLACLASYCETHLKVHNELNPGNRHKLTEATGELQKKVCSNHEKLLEIYCRTDQQCICYLCMMDEHKRHDTVSAAAGRAEKQTQLRATQSEFQQMIQQREKEMQQLREAVDSLTVSMEQRRRQQLAAGRAISGLSSSHTRSAQAAVDRTDRIFTDMIHFIEKRCSELKEVIRAQEKAAVSSAEGLMEKLKQEISELRSRNAEIQQLSYTDDHIYFLQNFQSWCSSPGCENLPQITVHPHSSYADMVKRVSELKDKLVDMFKEEFVQMFEMAKEVKIVTNADPSPFGNKMEATAVRGELLLYACQISLDPETAHKELYLSEGYREVMFSEGLQPYPDHPERFDFYHQVLCREGLTGRCYWEVEWSGRHGVHIALAYKGISRKGWANSCSFGYNDSSWCLVSSSSGYFFWHDKKKTTVSGPISSTIGVYLDHGAGTLSFYSVSDTVNLLHRVHTSFTEPLYPAFGLPWFWSKLTLCPLEW